MRPIPCPFPRGVRLLAPLLALVVAGTAAARPPVEQPDNLLNDRFGMTIAFAQSTTSSSVRLDRSDGTLGTEIAIEDELGLDDSKLLGRGEVWFRMRERHRARLGTYFLPLKRRGDATLTRTIDFGNERFVVGERVESDVRLSVLALAYSYSFVRNERVELAASLGFDIIGFEAKVRVPARLRTEREERSGPAPLAGLDGTVRISRRWYGEARAQYLRVNISDVEGSLLAYDLNLLWRLHPNVTLGLGYTGFDVDVDSQNAGDTGRFDLTTRGPQLFARFGF